jgi:hypothetical protein
MKVLTGFLSVATSLWAQPGRVAHASWLTEEHSLVELLACHLVVISYATVLAQQQVHHINNHDLSICENERWCSNERVPGWDQDPSARTGTLMDLCPWD